MITEILPLQLCEYQFCARDPPVYGDVYVTVVSHMESWGRNKMQYDSTRGLYAARLLLKQGWYDYHTS